MTAKVHPIQETENQPQGTTRDIGEKTITEVKRMVGEAMRTYLTEINDAYLGEADALSLKFGVKLSPAKSGTAIDLSFGFVTGRIKDKFIAYADEKQLPMFPQEEGKEI